VKVFACAIVIAAHALLLWLATFVLRDEQPRAAPGFTPMVAEILLASPQLDASVLTPAPHPIHSLERLDAPNIEFEEDEPSSTDAKPGIGIVRVPFRAPLLLSEQSVDLAQLVAKANVAVPNALTTVVAIDVSPAGVSETVVVEQSSGNPSFDLIAVDYARALRWRPGIVQDQPSKIRVRFPVRVASQGLAQR
jgi:TonB family protein